MPQVDDLSRSLVAFDQDSTMVVVIELSQKSWLVRAMVPRLKRDPLKKLAVGDAPALLAQLHRWKAEAGKAGASIRRVAVAYEAGRDGFWLARWLRTHAIEAHVMHAASVAVSREHKRAKTDRLDLELLRRSFLGWLRGEAKHCQMVAIPTAEEEDARRPSREHTNLTSEVTRIVNQFKAALTRFGVANFNPRLRKAGELLTNLRTPEGSGLPPRTLAELQRSLARLAQIREQMKEIERQRLERLEREPTRRPHAMVLLLARIRSISVETADTLVSEALSRQLRDRRAGGRFVGLTGAPDESGHRRREKGLARVGNVRVRRVMIQLAWRFLMFQKQSALAQWFEARTSGDRRLRKKMIVALARKLFIALWRLVTIGEVPQGLVMRPAQAAAA